MTEYFINQDIPNAIILINKLLDKGFNPRDILSVLVMHFRNLMKAKSEKTVDLIKEEENIINTIIKQSKEFSTDQILNALSCLNECSSNYKNAINQHFLVELCVMQLCSLEKYNNKEKKKNYNS
jgi:DNA polymerase-3 subunit gamma/tau